MIYPLNTNANTLNVFFSAFVCSSKRTENIFATPTENYSKDEHKHQSSLFRIMTISHLTYQANKMSPT
jgi:hypothetical protein